MLTVNVIFFYRLKLYNYIVEIYKVVMWGLYILEEGVSVLLKKRSISVIIILLVLLCYAEGKENYTNNLMKDAVFYITQEIGEISEDEIFLIDLMSRAYKRVDFTGGTLCSNNNSVNITFLTVENEKRIAEIRIEPVKETITIKYKFGDLKMALYDPNTGKCIYISKNCRFKKWLNYKICVDQDDKKIMIIRIKK